MKTISTENFSLIDCAPAWFAMGGHHAIGGKLWQEIYNKIDATEDELIALDKAMDEQGETAELLAKADAVRDEKEELEQALELVEWFYENSAKIDTLREIFPNLR